MLPTLDRRAASSDPTREVKFQVIIKPLDEHFTHGEIERCDKAALMAALAKCADLVEEVLRKVPQRERPNPTLPVPASMKRYVNGSGAQ